MGQILCSEAMGKLRINKLIFVSELEKPKV